MIDKEYEKVYRALAAEISQFEEPNTLAVLLDNEVEVIYRSFQEAVEKELSHPGANKRPHLLIINPFNADHSIIEKAKELSIPIIAVVEKEFTDPAITAVWLEEYAEDVLSLPFNPKELAVRIRRILHSKRNFQYADAQKPVLLIENTEYRPYEQKVESNDRQIKLTYVENRMLFLISRFLETGVHKKYICNVIWPGLNFREAKKNLYTTRSRLSTKLKSVDLIIMNNGENYILQKISNN